MTGLTHCNTLGLSSPPSTTTTTTNTQQLSHERKKLKMTTSSQSPPPTPPPPPQYTICPSCFGHGTKKNRRNNHTPCTTCSNTGLLPSSIIPPFHATLPPILIIGSGIAGSALALALHHRRIPYLVFERDNHFEERAQGYGLTMQQGTRALRALGLDDIVAGGGGDGDDDGEMSRYGWMTSTRHVVCDSRGNLRGEWGLRVWGGRPKKDDDDERINNDKNKSPPRRRRQNVHVARQRLRRALMAGLSPDRIRWNERLVSFEDDGDDGVSITTSGGSVVKGCLLVGADGIRSTVRRIKFGSGGGMEDDDSLRYLGCIVILGIVATRRVSTSLPPPSSSPSRDYLDNATVCQMADGITRIYFMPFSPTEIMWQLSFPQDEDAAERLSRKGPTALKDEALRRCEEWSEPIPSILRRTEEETITGYPVYDRDLMDFEIFRQGTSKTTKTTTTTMTTGGDDDDDELQSSSRVTLIGDAAHPMSPFKGQGANQALLDGISLARGLSRVLLPLDDDKQSKRQQRQRPPLSRRMESMLRDVECEMLRRVKGKVVASREAATFLHSEVAIREGNMTRAAAYDEEVKRSRADEGKDEEKGDG